MDISSIVRNGMGSAASISGAALLLLLDLLSVSDSLWDEIVSHTIYVRCSSADVDFVIGSGLQECFFYLKLFRDEPEFIPQFLKNNVRRIKPSDIAVLRKLLRKMASSELAVAAVPDTTSLLPCTTPILVLTGVLPLVRFYEGLLSPILKQAYENTTRAAKIRLAIDDRIALFMQSDNMDKDEYCPETLALHIVTGGVAATTNKLANKLLKVPYLGMDWTAAEEHSFRKEFEDSEEELILTYKALCARLHVKEDEEVTGDHFLDKMLLVATTPFSVQNFHELLRWFAISILLQKRGWKAICILISDNYELLSLQADRVHRTLKQPSSANTILWCPQESVLIVGAFRTLQDFLKLDSHHLNGVMFDESEFAAVGDRCVLQMLTARSLSKDVNIARFYDQNGTVLDYVVDQKYEPSFVSGKKTVLMTSSSPTFSTTTNAFCVEHLFKAYSYDEKFENETPALLQQKFMEGLPNLRRFCGKMCFRTDPKDYTSLRH